MHNNQIEKTSGHPVSSGLWIGMILLLAGLALLGFKLGLPIPGWLFTWPMILILIGILIGIKNRFSNQGSWILLFLGFIFLANKNIAGFSSFRPYIIPVALIAAGISIMFRRRQNYTPPPSSGSRFAPPAEGNTGELPPASGDDAEYLDVHSVFGGMKKFVLSKNFKGGNIGTFMGGAEINFSQADIREPILLEVNNIFGGTKLIVPANWDVRNEVTAVFGGVEDKRNLQAIVPDPGKTILIRGTCLFGGVEFASH